MDSDDGLVPSESAPPFARVGVQPPPRHLLERLALPAGVRPCALGLGRALGGLEVQRLPLGGESAGVDAAVRISQANVPDDALAGRLPAPDAHRPPFRPRPGGGRSAGGMMSSVVRNASVLRAGRPGRRCGWRNAHSSTPARSHTLPEASSATGAGKSGYSLDSCPAR